MDTKTFWTNKHIRKQSVAIVQINLGNMCNQACSHCHVAASPSGNKYMDRETAQNVMQQLAGSAIRHIEFTGGAPELNPSLKWFVRELVQHNKTITVRTNLAVLDMPEHASYFELYRNCRVKLIASLMTKAFPC
jgi:MoaA/NifB/PqqE/SkfB family radical SAM enzyme